MPLAIHTKQAEYQVIKALFSSMSMLPLQVNAFNNLSSVFAAVCNLYAIPDMSDQLMRLQHLPCSLHSKEDLFKVMKN